MRRHTETAGDCIILCWTLIAWLVPRDIINVVKEDALPGSPISFLSGTNAGTAITKQLYRNLNIECLINGLLSVVDSTGM